MTVIDDDKDGVPLSVAVNTNVYDWTNSKSNGPTNDTAPVF